MEGRREGVRCLMYGFRDWKRRGFWGSFGELRMDEIS